MTLAAVADVVNLTVLGYDLPWLWQGVVKREGMVQLVTGEWINPYTVP